MIRERAGLTQADVAAILTVDRTAVSRWETGSRRPSARMVCPYVALLGWLQEEIVDPPHVLAEWIRVLRYGLAANDG